MVRTAKSDVMLKHNCMQVVIKDHLSAFSKYLMHRDIKADTQIAKYVARQKACLSIIKWHIQGL